MMLRSLAAFAACLSLLATLATAQTPPQRLRGEVISFDGHWMQLKNRNGETQKIEFSEKTTYVGVVKAERSAIKAGAYVGIASIKGTGDAMTAEEVLVFPEASRGSNEGHYPWDLTPGGMMTNANISAMVESTKGPELTLTYKNKDGTGGNVKIQVAQDTPVVAFDKADKGDIKAGGHVLVVAAKDGDKLTALRVLIGKGIKPPM
jgi:hypothetical protein